MAAALFALICLIWGSTWLAIKFGLMGTPPFLGAGLRFLLSATIVGMILAVRRKRLRLTRADRICVLSLGLLVFWLDYAAVYWAETRISSGLTAILFSTMPLMTAVLSAYWTRSETLSARKTIGIVVGIMGTALLFWPQERLQFDQALGMLAALGGALCAAINLVTLKRHGGDADPLVLNFFGMGLGAICLLAMSAALENWSAIQWNATNIAALCYLSLFGSVIAFSAYYYVIKKLDATIVSLTTLISPIVALALGRAFLGETVTAMALTGIATVLGGVAVASVPKWNLSRLRRNRAARPATHVATTSR
jgi:putative membrane protein PagO